MTMFGTQQCGVKAYTKVGIETGVDSASPHQLIVMLFDGALSALSAGLMHMKSGAIAEKGQAISKSILIIESGLRASLDKEAGGEIAFGLDALYDYMGRRLLAGNLNNDPHALEEVQQLLTGLRDAWTAIGAMPAVLAHATRSPSPGAPQP
jgi:flagellar protein FliS